MGSADIQRGWSSLPGPAQIPVVHALQPGERPKDESGMDGQIADRAVHQVNLRIGLTSFHSDK